MFTVFAILFTIVGGILFAYDLNKKPVDQFNTANNVGGWCLFIAVALWICVIVALIFRFFAWAWTVMP